MSIFDWFTKKGVDVVIEPSANGGYHVDVRDHQDGDTLFVSSGKRLRSTVDHAKADVSKLKHIHSVKVVD